MNMRARITILVLLPCTSVLTSSGLAQGSLTPPGPPAPTMRTLDQVEPRIPLAEASLGVIVQSNGGFTITQPGSYYLTRNLTVAAGDGVTIAADGVSLDLRGFTISSSANSGTGTGITLAGDGRRNIAIQNGHISGAITLSEGVYSGAGFHTGIGQSGFNVRGVRISDMSVGGCRQSGISIAETNGFGATVERCSVTLAGGTGIRSGTVADSSATQCREGINASLVVNSLAIESVETGIVGKTVTNCTSTLNGGKGIVAETVAGCSATRNGGVGIEGRQPFPLSVTGGTVTGSTAANNRAIGIHARLVVNCTAVGNHSHGIQAVDLAKDNSASLNGAGIGNLGAGIYFTGNGVRIESNNCFENDWGIQSAPSSNGIIVRNSCRSNSATPTNPGASGNFDFDRTSNTYGPVITVNGDMSANAAASHPAANIQY